MAAKIIDDVSSATTIGEIAVGSVYGGDPAHPVLLLLDGHSLAFRAFYALPVESFGTSTGQATNAVYGFTSMLINLLRDEKPTHIAVAFDLPGGTWRNSEFPDYKAQRAPTPEPFIGQIGLIEQILAALNITSVSAADYEADDVIATLATAAAADGMQVRICTGDRDALQLVTDKVTVLYPIKGVSELRRYTPKTVEEKYDLTPAQYPDFAALRGDPSDNLPGIPGVGEKTATKWIKQYESLAGLVDHLAEVTGKVGDSLRTNIDNVLLNRRLTELIRDVELPVAPGDLAAAVFDREELHSIFDDLQFRTLRKRFLENFGSQDAVETDQQPEISIDRLSAGAVAQWLQQETNTARVAIHSSGEFGAGGGDVHRLIIATGTTKAAIIDTAALTEEDDTALAEFLATETTPKVLHDAKPQINALAARGWQLGGVICDTQLAAYLALPGQRSFDVADLVQRYVGRSVEGTSDDGQLSLLPDEQGDTSDAHYTHALLELATALEKELATAQQQDLLHELEIPVMFVLAQMEQAGIAVDTDYLDQLQSRFAAEVLDAEQAAWGEIDGEVNLSSPKQLQAVLFDQLNMPKTKRTKTGYTTGAAALQDLYEKTGHPFLAHLLRHRDVTKLRTTVEGLQKATADDNRIHTSFLQTVAATGRLSSTEPNLQNVPVRTAEGRLIRAAFVPGAGFEGLLTADYSQIEMRIMAHLSKDAGLIEAFKSGEDLHAAVAARTFNVPTTEVSPELRRRVKAMSYGLAYGLSAYGLSEQLKISVDEAREHMDAYFARFGHVREYLDDVVATARRTGYTETMMGRRRYLPELASSNRQRREMAERIALNAPIQGSAADIIKVAMLRLQRRIAAAGLSSRLLLQVHDELVCEVAPGERETLTEIVTAEMSGAADLLVPLEVSVGYGENWDEAAH